MREVPAAQQDDVCNRSRLLNPNSVGSLLKLPLDVDPLVPWLYFNTTSRRALIQVCWKQMDVDLSTMPGISLSLVREIGIQDLMDLNHFGKRGLEKLFSEIEHAVLCSLDIQERLARIGDKRFDIQVSEETIESIVSSTNLSILAKNLLDSLFEHQANIYDVPTALRDKEIWSLTLPWATDKPRNFRGVARRLMIPESLVQEVSSIGHQFKWNLKVQLPLFDHVANSLLEAGNIAELKCTLSDDDLLGDDINNMGRIRFLALALEAEPLRKEFESAIYRWSSRL